MNIEEKFNKEVIWLLEELQKEMLVKNENAIRFYFIHEDSAPSERDQQRILFWMRDLGVLEITNNLYPEGFLTRMLMNHPLLKGPAAIGYELKIDNTGFSNLLEIYKDIDKKSAKEILDKANKLRKAKKVEIRPQLIDRSPTFNEEERAIIYLGKICNIPVGNQFELSKALFKVPAGTWVKESDVVERFSRGDNKQSFYDAFRQLDKRVSKDLGIKDLFEYSNSMAKINIETIRKLNDSEK